MAAFMGSFSEHEKSKKAKSALRIRKWDLFIAEI
jgi:hypothetical protein